MISGGRDLGDAISPAQPLQTPPPPAQSRRIALRPASAAACPDCRARVRPQIRPQPCAIAPRAAASWCPTFAPGLQVPPGACPPARRARLRARERPPASVPSGNSVGRSFRLCTARSARPSSSASSISLVNRPLAPTWASGTSVILSPVVLMISMRLGYPRAASCRCTQWACHRASCEPRDAMTSMISKTAPSRSRLVVR